MSELEKYIKAIECEELRREITRCVAELKIRENHRGFCKGYSQGYQEGYADGRSGKQPGKEFEDMPIEALCLSTRALNCLRGCQCTRVSDVVALSEEAIWRMRNLGKHTAREIATALRDRKIFHTPWDAYML